MRGFVLLCGDCLVEMEKLPSKSIDFILVDPPYGCTALEWDTPLKFSKVWFLVDRLLRKDGIVAIFSSQPFTSKLINSNVEGFSYCWYWLKNQGTNFFHAKRMPIRKIEEICIFGKGRYFPQMSDGHVPTNSCKGRSTGKVYYGKNIRNEKGGKTTRYPTNVLEFKCVSNYSRLHSSQKPLNLCEYLVSTYTKEGDTVLDFAMGSGTVGVACKNLSRKFIGIEIDKECFSVASRRIEGAKNAN